MKGRLDSMEMELKNQKNLHLFGESSSLGIVWFQQGES